MLACLLHLIMNFLSGDAFCFLFCVHRFSNILLKFVSKLFRFYMCVQTSLKKLLRSPQKSWLNDDVISISIFSRETVQSLLYIINQFCVPRQKAIVTVEMNNHVPYGIHVLHWRGFIKTQWQTMVAMAMCSLRISLGLCWGGKSKRRRLRFGAARRARWYAQLQSDWL